MKKIMAGMMATCIAFSPVLTPVFASEANTTFITSEEMSEAESMKEVLLLVKGKLTIPENLTEFSYRIRYSSGNYSGSKLWNFSWADKENKNSMSVTADSLGNILNYSVYNREKGTPKPTYLKEELLENAINFIKEIAPNISDKIVLEESEFSGIYDGRYLYTFVRIENGIKMPDNEVSVSVNYETGEVEKFGCAWTFDVEIPTSETNLTIEDAREKIGEKVNMNLVYRNKTEEIDGKKVVKAYLVYIPDKSYIAIDAKNGNIYNTKDDFYEMNMYESDNRNGDASFDIAEEEAGGLTEVELEKIREIEDLITKEEAILAVTSRKDELLLDELSKAVDARLAPKYDYSEGKNVGYVWNLEFSDPRSVEKDSGDTYRPYANVTVDAKTGKILSFYSSVRSYYNLESEKWEDVKVNYTFDECKKIFEKFVNSLEKEKFDNTKLSKSSSSAYVLKYVEKQPIYGGYSYNYFRQNEGIEYSYNKIYGKVDGVTGKIYSYSVDWTDNIEFESPKEAMSAEDAYKAYSQKEGFELVYEINNKHYIENDPDTDKYYDYSDLYILEKEARLVYRTDIYPENISPFTGEQLDYSGEVYTNTNKKEYTDISGLLGERDIRLITDMGYTFDGDKFLPEEAITKEEWFDLLRVVGSYTSEEEYKDLEKLTNIEAIKIIIKNLGLEKVANLSDIYKVEVNDIDEIEASDIGYVALAKGLNIISADSDGNINPNKELNRKLAISMALRLLLVR